MEVGTGVVSGLGEMVSEAFFAIKLFKNSVKLTSLDARMTEESPSSSRASARGSSHELAIPAVSED